MTKQQAIDDAKKRAAHWRSLKGFGNQILINEFHVVRFNYGFDVVTDRYFKTYREKKSYFKEII